MVFVTSGIFVDIENSKNCIAIENYVSKYKEGYSPLPFHSGLYFVIVTLTTVGYGDINAETNPAKVCTVLLIILTVAIVPS
jgi:hypothetical protein